MSFHYVKTLTQQYEDQVRRNPSLNIDSFIIPSPYIVDQNLTKDYQHSFVWEEERELLSCMEVYSDPDRLRFHIYKLVTSPFARAKGIGSALLAKLAAETPSTALIDIFIWERQTKTIAFFKRRGFTERDRITWRALNFLRLEAQAQAITAADIQSSGGGAAEELGKIRHDAKKTIRLIADMAGALSAENCSRIIEDINRETTALINTLNLFRDSVQRFRTVNLKDLILDRIVPLVEYSPIDCELRLRFGAQIAEARAHYVEVARAIVNLVSNALDAIKASGRTGIISIGLENSGDWVVLSVEDNGIGISPERLAPGPDGRPRFIGVTTKGQGGEGQGTRQIYTAFGAENISIKSEAHSGSRWTLRLPRALESADSRLRDLDTRWAEFRSLTEPAAHGKVSATAVKAERSAAIWRQRKLEILIWDLILQFGLKNNVRELYRTFLAYRHNKLSLTTFKQEVKTYKIELGEVRNWLVEAARLLKTVETVSEADGLVSIRSGAWFKAYGQASERTVIFTLNPADGRYGATDRKLAEHSDFVPYLGNRRDRLLRGEFFGDLRKADNPIQLGVWEIGDQSDGRRKAALIRSGARCLLEMGLAADKKLLFYESTWRRGFIDLDSNQPRRLGDVANIGDYELGDLLVTVDDDPLEFIGAD